MEHSTLPPSSAARRVACPGSRALEEKFPEDQDSPHAREGHAAHRVALCYLANEFDPDSKDYPDINKVPKLGESCLGETVTQDMIDGAEMYADEIASLLRRLIGFKDATWDKLHVEERISISSIHPDCWGTPDCWFSVGNVIHIWDYKFGHGPVDVFENWQLIEYMAGVFEKLEINGIRDQQIYVYFHIIQPRSFHQDGPTRTWAVRGCDLRPYFNTLRGAEAKAAEPTAFCYPSPECDYCSARHACPALQVAALKATDVSKQNDPFILEGVELGSQLRYLKKAAALLDARITGLSEQVISGLRGGANIPHFKLEQGAGRDRWKKDPAEIITMGHLLGHNLAKPVDVITPRQAVKAGVPETLINSLVERKPGSMKLVEDTGDLARKIFGGSK